MGFVIYYVNCSIADFYILQNISNICYPRIDVHNQLAKGVIFGFDT